MTDVKRLLDEATPLPWMADAPPVTLDRVEDQWGIFAAARDRNTCIALLGTDKQDRNDAALIVYATNALPRFLALYEEAATVINGDEAFNPDGSSRMPALAAAVEALRELDE